MGITTEQITPQIARAYRLPTRSGLYIAQVVPGSAADKAGMKAGDILVKFANQDIATTADLQDVLLQRKPGEQVPVTYYEGSTLKTATLTLQEASASQG